MLWNSCTVSSKNKIHDEKGWQKTMMSFKRIKRYYALNNKSQCKKKLTIKTYLWTNHRNPIINLIVEDSKKLFLKFHLCDCGIVIIYLISRCDKDRHWST